MRAIRKRDLGQAVDLCGKMHADGMALGLMDFQWDGDKLKPGEQNDNIRTRAAELREAIKVMLGNDKGRRGKGREEAPPAQDGPFCRDCACWPYQLTEFLDGSKACKEGRSVVREDTIAPGCFQSKPTPPDPYGGKVLEDGRIEYVDRGGKTRAIDPNGEIAGFKRGDVVRFCCRSSTDLVLGTGPTNFLANALWAKDGEGKIGFYSDVESLSHVSRAANPQEIRLDGADVKITIDGPVRPGFIGGDVVKGGIR